MYESIGWIIDFSKTCTSIIYMWTHTNYTHTYLSDVILTIPSLSLSYTHENYSCVSLWCIITSKLFLVMWFYCYYSSHMFLNFVLFSKFHLFIYHPRACNVLDIVWIWWTNQKSLLRGLFSALKQCSYSWHKTCVTWVKARIFSYKLSCFHSLFRLQF